MRAFFLGLAIMHVAILAGCQRAPAPDKIYDVKGKVVAVDAEKNAITLDHDDIPGLMKAMQMDFIVHDPKELAGLSPGDRVQGKLNVKPGGNYLVTELRKR